MFWSLILSGILAGALAALLGVPLAIRLAHKYDLLDRPGRHKRHKRPVPILGGSALFASVWLSVIMLLIFHKVLLTDYIPALPYIFAGSLIIFLVGFSDDLRPLSPWVKLLSQVAAGLILYLGGLKIDPITVPFIGDAAVGDFSLAITIIWVIGLTNAINLIDGLDGLAAGVSLIGALTMLVIGSLYTVAGVVMFAAAVSGFLFIFLVYNRYPAKIFLGDSGALQLGFYFAVISLLVPVKSFTAAALYLPLLVLGVPLLETTSSILRRLVTGRHLMRPDRRHIFHYLELAGLSARKVVLIFYALSLLFSGFTLAMYFWNRRLVLGLLILFMVVILGAFFIFMTKSSQVKRRNSRLKMKTGERTDIRQDD